MVEVFELCDKIEGFRHVLMHFPVPSNTFKKIRGMFKDFGGGPITSQIIIRDGQFGKKPYIHFFVGFFSFLSQGLDEELASGRRVGSYLVDGGFLTVVVSDEGEKAGFKWPKGDFIRSSMATFEFQKSSLCFTVSIKKEDLLTYRLWTLFREGGNGNE